MNLRKTRIAPTPSGYLHLGNLLSFALTAYLAGRSGASLLLRIDDMDGDRKRPEYVEDVFDTLNFFGIHWDSGPGDAMDFEANYSQHLRLPLYEAALRQLVEQNQVYACTCSRSAILQASADGRYPGSCREKDLPLDTPGATWRLRTDERTLVVHAYESPDALASLPARMEDFVVRRKDGLPAYQLASLVDDLHFGVDFIVRGEDLLDSTLAQLYLAQVLNQPAFLSTVFLHHPLVQTADGRKLSKSAGDTSIHYLRAQGETAPAILQRLARQLGLPEVTSVQELGQEWWMKIMAGT